MTHIAPDELRRIADLLDQLNEDRWHRVVRLGAMTVSDANGDRLGRIVWDRSAYRYVFRAEASR